MADFAADDGDYVEAANEGKYIESAFLKSFFVYYLYDGPIEFLVLVRPFLVMLPLSEISPILLVLSQG